ncbi:MAG: FAD-dependent monooxygenase [Cyanobacteria bacterium J06576_12]
MERKIKTDVIIVGAGPTGLSLAGQLLRYGIDFIIIDMKEGITDLSKAIILHARTMEIYDQIGLANRIVDRGRILHTVMFITDGKVTASPDFSKIGDHRFSPFAYFMIHPQSETEQLLYDYLRENNQEVQWQTKLQSFSHDKSGVQATIKSITGETQTIEADYLVGCDGASSTVREQLNLKFEGSTYPHLFYVVDVEMEIKSDGESMLAALGKDAYLLMLPLPGEKHWRFTGNMPEYDIPGKGQDSDTLIPFSQIEVRLKRLVNRSLSVHKVNWQSQYKVHTRYVEQFGKGRCFLAGDAAHVHTPAGGQGMNTGIQDVYNLAWKLDMVLKGQADASLLCTYSEERLANAKRLVRSTDQMFDLLTAQSWYTEILRNYLLPSFAQLMTRLDPIKEITFPFLSQIGINYRDQSLSQHQNDGDFKVKDGDRMPYFLVDGANVYDKFRSPKFRLIVLSNGEHSYRELELELEEEYGGSIDFGIIPLYPRTVAIFGTDQSFKVLLRPDNYIGLISEELSLNDVRAYFNRLAEKDSEQPVRTSTVSS